VTVSLRNRRKLEEAISRLVEGTVTPTNGKLTWKNVAALAGVSKATADRAVDLRDGFRRALEEHVPTAVARPQTESSSRTDIDEELTRLRRENGELKQTTKVLHAVILALVQENQRLGRRGRDDGADNVPSNLAQTRTGGH
jgi:hypothetical protein